MLSQKKYKIKKNKTNISKMQIYELTFYLYFFLNQIDKNR